MPEPEHINARTDRTLRYTGGLHPRTPASVNCGQSAAQSPVGQAVTLTAVNMLARVHPTVVMTIPDVPLIVPCRFPSSSLAEACAALARAANPTVRTTSHPNALGQGMSIGIGIDAPPSTIYVGAQRWTALTGLERQPLSEDPSSLLGAAMAVSIACGNVFRAAIGLPVCMARAASLWTMTTTDQPTGPAEFGAIDVGSTWLIGAGAVGAGIAWWLQYVGVTGQWTVIDGDHVDETNLNRSLAFFAGDAGLTGDPPATKVDVAAKLINGAAPIASWWDDFVSSDPAMPDVLLPVANERAIRPSIACLGHPAVLHATTSPNWTAELHRHLLDHDDCIACRLPETAPRFQCATAIPETPADSLTGEDAALPFLSATAGLLLLAGLKQLEEGHWDSHQRNHWRWWFDDAARPIASTRWACRSVCTATPPPTVRRIAHGQTRWRTLDPDQHR
jgi:hypothetical protein